MKNIIIIALQLISFCSLAQNGVLATLGNQKILSSEFIWAFNKNNRSEKPKAAAIKEYLDLHINYKLKVQEAYNLKLDTSEIKRNEYAQLYNSMADKYIGDENVYTAVVTEAFNRMQTDRLVKHIYVKVTDFNNTPEVKVKLQKINDAYTKLNKKTPFQNVAAEYSEDDASKNNGGNIGAITAFTLPYTLENIIYNTKVGNYTNVITSKTGYHIFYISNQIKATGNIYARQILLANDMYPDGSNKQLAQTTFAILQKQPNLFDSLVQAISNDQSNVNNKGLITPFTVGQYDATFETGVLAKNSNAAFNLFQSALGWHITVLDSIKATSNILTNNLKDSLTNIIKFMDRGRNAKDDYISNMLPRLGYKQNLKFGEDKILQIAENIVAKKDALSGLNINNVNNIIMHSFTKANINVTDFINYFKAFVASNAYNKQPVKELVNNYIVATARDYYTANYADYNTEFKYLMTEFKDGNVYFDFMQNKVWNKASEDEIALKNYYNANKTNYLWKQGLSGIIVSASNETIANELYALLNKGTKNWANLVLPYDDKARIDSGRYEYENVIIKNPKTLKPLQITIPEKLNDDGWFTFMYVTKVHSNNEQRSYDDAKGLASNDYQLVLDQQVIDALKLKYKVVVNKAELDKLIKK